MWGKKPKQRTIKIDVTGIEPKPWDETDQKVMANFLDTATGRKFIAKLHLGCHKIATSLNAISEQDQGYRISLADTAAQMNFLASDDAIVREEEDDEEAKELTHFWDSQEA